MTKNWNQEMALDVELTAVEKEIFIEKITAAGVPSLEEYAEEQGQDRDEASEKYYKIYGDKIRAARDAACEAAKKLEELKKDYKELYKFYNILSEKGYIDNLNITLNPNTKALNVFVNCEDTQCLMQSENHIRFCTVGGSRYSWEGTNYTAEEAAEIMLKELAKTSEDIDKEYRAIWSGLQKTLK